MATSAVVPASVLPAPPAPTPDAEEAALSAEILDLWARHAKTTTTARRTREDLRKLRITLGEKLQTMKALLARPGRGGNWTAYLKTNGLARATADRYVVGYEHSLELAKNRLNEAIVSPEEQAWALVQRLLPRLRKLLSTDAAVARFYAELSAEIPPTGPLACRAA